MAARASAKSKNARKGKVPSRGKVATLPPQSTRAKNAAKGNGGKRGKVGHNSGGISDEVYQTFLDRIDRTRLAMDKSKELYDQAKGVHQSAFKAAKEAGCDTDAIRLAHKLNKQDAGQVQILYANVSRILDITESPLGTEQLNLFGSIAPPKPAEEKPSVRGLKAGEAGVDRRQNPYTPGSEEFAEYDSAWVKGQERIAARMGDKATDSGAAKPH